MNIAILASGGDGAGMNRCLFELCKRLHKKHEVVLYNEGYRGIIKEDFCNFSFAHIKQNKNKGGIIIKTSRFKEFMDHEVVVQASNNLKKHNIDVLVVLGGNGSLRGAIELEKCGTRVVFIPCTIDNDVKISEYSIGFDTACENCTNFVKHIHQTMQSFNRTCIYEAMGRENPSIAITVANRVNADYLYVGKSCTLENCTQTIKNALKTNSAPIIILRENLMDIQVLKKHLVDNLNIDVKTCIVGYVQRGGNPTKREIEMCKQFAKVACKAINKDTVSGSCVVSGGNFVFSAQPFASL